MPTVLLVADSRPTVGFGHLSRCMTLSRALVARGARCILLVHSDAVKGIGAVEGVTVQVGDDPVMAAVENSADIVVIDGYGMPTAHAAALRRRKFRVVAIDDDGLPDLQVDLVVNPNAHAGPEMYRGRSLTGPAYAMIRPEFAPFRARPRRYDRMRRILVCMGGGDPNGITVRAVEGLLEAVTMQPAIELVVVLGTLCRDALEDEVSTVLQPRRHGVRLLRAPKDFPELLAGADIALLSGGVVLTEAIHLGVPSVALVIADNQRQGVSAWTMIGAVIEAQPKRAEIAQAVTRLLRDEAARARLGEKAWACVDGQGAARIVGMILDLDHSVPAL